MPRGRLIGNRRLKTRPRLSRKTLILVFALFLHISTRQHVPNKISGKRKANTGFAFYFRGSDSDQGPIFIKKASTA